MTQSIARRPDCAAAWREASGQPPNAIGAHRHAAAEPALTEDRFQASAATPINRLAVTILLELQRESESLAVLAEHCADVDMARRARLIGRNARRWTLQSPFSGLASFSAQEQLRLRRNGGIGSGDPVFQALYAHWRRLRQPLHFDWSASPFLVLPALPAWHLYEIWCLFQVAGCLFCRGWLPVGHSSARPPRKCGQDRPVLCPPTPSVNDLVHCAPDGLRLRLATGQASQLRFRRPNPTGRSALLTLTYRPLFASANRIGADTVPEDRTISPGVAAESGESETAACRSISHDMQPDIALQWHGRLYLLDAKYRRYAPRNAPDGDGPYQALLEDVNKMHTYRDSIVRGSRRVVCCAWCLFPGRQHFEPDVVAYPQPTTERPFGTAGVGALALCPGAQPLMLGRLLDHWFAG